LQDRSLRRFEKIITATEELLQVASISDISFYDIARQADISPASVNYLFPTMAALHLTMSQRYNEQCSGTMMEATRTLARMRNPSWQDWLAASARTLAKFMNERRPVCEVMLGPVLHIQSKRENCLANDRVAASMLENFRKVFILPEIPNLLEMLVVTTEVGDALWSRSYVLHGRITDEATNDLVRVNVAYLRTVLPESLALARDIRAVR
jgi:AcrR family transcriptional regulator